MQREPPARGILAFNATHDSEERRWKALQNHEMLRARKYVEAVYYHELAKDLIRFDYRIQNRARGDFEIAGVSDALWIRNPCIGRDGSLESQ